MKTSKRDTISRAVNSPVDERSYNFPLRVTPEFRTRIRVAARFNGSSISNFIREAVLAKLDVSETRQRQEREEKKERVNTFRGLGQSALAPAMPSALSALEVKSHVAKEPLPKDLYREHAKRIADAVSRPREMRLRLDEAVAAVKMQWPLTHPPEEQIIEQLEKLVAPILNKIKIMAEKSDNDELLGKTIAGIKTYGYTPTTDDEGEQE